MAYHGAAHMYATFVSDILIKRGDFHPEWWQSVQSRVATHLGLGTDVDVLADMFSEQWRIIRETGGWRGYTEEAAPEQSKAMRDTLRFCAVARRHGFA